MATTAGPGGDVKTDLGVTTAACPGSTHADRGCIYLGVLSDLTVGPFRALAVPLTDGQKAFWKRVNDGNGIGGKYDVDITKYTRDNKYNPQEHVAQLRQILPNILALAQSLGTPPTIAAKDIMEDERPRRRAGLLVVRLGVRRSRDRERSQLLLRVDERARLGVRGRSASRTRSWPSTTPVTTAATRQPVSPSGPRPTT